MGSYRQLEQRLEGTYLVGANRLEKRNASLRAKGRTLLDVSFDMVNLWSSNVV